MKIADNSYSAVKEYFQTQLAKFWTVQEIDIFFHYFVVNFFDVNEKNTVCWRDFFRKSYTKIDAINSYCGIIHQVFDNFWIKVYRQLSRMYY